VIAASALDDLLVTAEGYERLRRELETLRGEGRRAMSERLREARADGHLEDNPALFDLLEEQAQLERRIATLEVRWRRRGSQNRTVTAAPASEARSGCATSIRASCSSTSWSARSRATSARDVCPSRRRLGVRFSALPPGTLSPSPARTVSFDSR
jgi:hypothetical protein